jgi:RimJ/RimL family protein N-acetyltransferase
VLDRVRHAGLIRRLIGRADADPGLDRGDRRRVTRRDVEGQAIFESVGMNFVHSGGGRGGSNGAKSGGERDERGGSKMIGTGYRAGHLLVDPRGTYVKTPPPTLTTARLVLRELRPGDAAAVAAGAGDPRVAQHLIQVPSPYPVSLARNWILHRIGWWTLGRGVTYAIAAAGQPQHLLGTVSLRRYARDRRAELGYWLAAGAWGHGFATEAARAALDFGFADLALARVYAQVLAGNRASLHVLDKLGMVNEGIKRQHICKAERLHDVVLYGLLRDEWSAR